MWESGRQGCRVKAASVRLSVFQQDMSDSDEEEEKSDSSDSDEDDETSGSTDSDDDDDEVTTVPFVATTQNHHGNQLL